MRDRFLSFVAAVALSFAAGAAAQSFPSKPVRIIVSYAPGGMTDTLGRLLSKELTEMWGVSVIVENRPGASGNIGTTACVKAPPDGYTLCEVAVAQAMASRVSSNAGFDSLKDFTHVSLIANVPMLLLAHPSLPVRNVSQLVALAKRRPGVLNYASSGGGASPHLAMELFKERAGVDIVLVTYKGTGAAIMDQIAGRVDVAFNPAVGVVPYVQGGKLRALGVSTRARFPVLPDVPTISESGVKGYDASSWQGISMPAGVPRDILQRISAGVMAALAKPDIKERILALGGVAAGDSPEEFAKFFREESDKWYQVARKAGIVM